MRGPYLAMVTIAFGFVVEHGAIEWRGLTGGQNGLMGIPPADARRHAFGERGDGAASRSCLPALSLYLLPSAGRAAPWGKAMRRGARLPRSPRASIGLDPVVVKTVAFALSALFAGRRRRRCSRR